MKDLKLAFRVAVVLLAIAGLAVACGSDDSESAATSALAADYSYVIPAGTGDAIDRGEEVDVMPAELTVTVGQVLELVNEDDRGHTIGPFFVGSGESLRHEFASPGTLEGVCSVNPSGAFAVTVVEA